MEVILPRAARRACAVPRGAKELPKEGQAAVLLIVAQQSREAGDVLPQDYKLVGIDKPWGRMEVQSRAFVSLQSGSCSALQ